MKRVIQSELLSSFQIIGYFGFNRYIYQQAQLYYTVILLKVLIFS
jgi:hypothetical protein